MSCNLHRMLVRELRVYRQVLLNVSTIANPQLVPIANLKHSQQVKLDYCFISSLIVINIIYLHSQVSTVLHAWYSDRNSTAAIRSRCTSLISILSASRWLDRAGDYLNKLKAGINIANLPFIHPLAVIWLNFWRNRTRGGCWRQASTTLGRFCWSWHILLHQWVWVEVYLKTLQNSNNKSR